MKRLIYLAICGVLALTAAVLTLHAQHMVGVVVPTHDVKAGVQLQAGDLEVIQVSANGVPAGTLATTEAANGLYVAWPLTAGEPILSRTLPQQRSGGTIAGGYDVPNGYRAVAVPVLPAGAVGGMLAAGDHVDVYATPLTGHEQTVTAASGSGEASAADLATGATLVGSNVLVLELRSDQGQALDEQTGDSSVDGLDFDSEKLGSVVLAIPSDQVDIYASASNSMTIYLALDVH